MTDSAGTPERVTFAEIRTLFEELPGPDVEAFDAAVKRDRMLTKPPGALGRLEELGKGHEVYRFDAGHGSLVIEETIRQVEVALAFALRHVEP